MAIEWKKIGLGIAGTVSNPASTLLWAIHAEEKLEAQDAAEKAILGIFNKFKSKGVMAATSVYDSDSARGPCTPQLKHDLIIAIDGANERQLERLNEALPFKGEIKINDNVPSLVVRHEGETSQEANHKTMKQASILLKDGYERSAVKIETALRQITDEISATRGTVVVEESAKSTGGTRTPSIEAGFAALVAGTRRELRMMR